MPQACCSAACTTLQAFLLNAAHVLTLLLLQFQQQHLNNLNAQAHLFPRLPQDRPSCYTYYSPPPDPAAWPQHQWPPSFTDAYYETTVQPSTSEYAECETADLSIYQQCTTVPCTTSSWLQPLCYSPAIGAAEQQVTPLLSLPNYGETAAAPPTPWDGDPEQHNAADAAAAPPPSEDMTPCVLDMFLVAIHASRKWMSVPEEPRRVVLRCTPSSGSGAHNVTTTAPVVPESEKPPRASRRTPPPGFCVPNGTATTPFATPTGQVHRQTTSPSSASTRSEDLPPTKCLSAECENESHTDFPWDSPFAKVNVFDTLRVRDTPRCRSIGTTCEHVRPSTPEDILLADFTTVVHRPRQDRPWSVQQPPVPAVRRRRRRLGTLKHPRGYGRRKGSQFCRSQPALAHAIR